MYLLYKDRPIYIFKLIIFIINLPFFIVNFLCKVKKFHFNGNNQLNIMEKCICPFDFQEFSSRELLESHFSKSHTRPEKETSLPELVFSSGSYLSIDDSPPEPVAAMKECLSSALKNVKLPQNPLII